MSDPEPPRRVKALGLVSGGLDSTLAAKLLQEQGVEVEGVHFATGFCKIDHRRALQRPKDADHPERLRQQALRAGADLEVPVEIVDVAEEYFQTVVLRPKYGYGSAMNPCIDCRIFMLKKAKDLALERGADVVFTGEVVGQRPMSQHHAALRTIEQDAGLAGRLLRPLSAAHLPPTEIEQSGHIDRAKLGDVNGRTRRPQLELAQHFGIEEFPAPSGGCCFLADQNFGRRLKDLLAHRDPASVKQEDLLLLKLGRHFRLAHDLKVVFGRDEAESTWLRLNAGERFTVQVADGRGSYGLIDGTLAEEQESDVASLAARYSVHRDQPSVEVQFRRGELARIIQVAPTPSGRLVEARI